MVTLIALPSEKARPAVVFHGLCRTCQSSSRVMRAMAVMRHLYRHRLGCRPSAAARKEKLGGRSRTFKTVTIRNVDDQVPNKRQNKIYCRRLLLPVSERDRIGNVGFFSLAVFFFRAVPRTDL